MLRVGLLFALAFFLVLRIVSEGWGAAVKGHEEAAVSEGVGWWGARAREAVLLAAFLGLRVVCDLARADLVLSGRTSAFLAFWRGVGLVLRHPLRTLLTAALLGVPAYAALYGLSFVPGLVHLEGWWTILLLFFVVTAGQQRSAKGHGLVRLLRNQFVDCAPGRARHAFLHSRNNRRTADH